MANRSQRRAKVMISMVLAAMVLSVGSVEAQQAPSSHLAPSESLTPLARDFLLDGPTIYKVGRRSHNLIVEDLTGNGLPDIMVINNERSVIEFFRQTNGENLPVPKFEREELPLDRPVRAAKALDVNGNGRIDLVIASAPARLSVIYQDENGRLQDPVDTDIEATRLIPGDFTGDGRDDLMVFHNGKFTLLPATRRGLSLSPAQEFFTSTEPAATPMALDFDGDGRLDLVFQDARRLGELVIRLQSPEGTFPAEFRESTGVLRQATTLPGSNGRDSLIGVLNQNRKIVKLNLGSPDERGGVEQRLPLSRPLQVSFDTSWRARNPLISIADIDGDGRTDIILHSSELPQAKFFRQTRTGALQGEAFSVLDGLEVVIPLPVDHGTPAPLLLFSREEQAVGIARHDGDTGGIPFPRLFPLRGRIQSVAVANIAGEQALLAIIDNHPNHEGRRLLAWHLDEEGNLGEKIEVDPGEEGIFHGASLRDSNRAPREIEVLDINRNGLDDLLVFSRFEDHQILLQQEDGTFTRATTAPGVLSGLLDGARHGTIRRDYLHGTDSPPSVFILRDRFLRVLHLDEEDNVVVEQQFNGRNTDARLNLFTVARLRDDNTRQVVIHDRGNNELSIFSPVTEDTKGAWELLSTVSVEDLGWNELRAADLDGNGRDEIILVTGDRLSILSTTPFSGGIKTVASAQPFEDEGGYGRVYTADLFDGGRQEVIALEMRDNLMEFFEVAEEDDGTPSLRRFYSFKMFDTESGLVRRINLDTPPEPRDLIVTDLNGDGRNEVITLTHDKIIIYHQTSE
ncbi:MAG: VCBS repeat-containing protein [Candidatus Sumerlaeia bacterium]|nr:VCBS repeat-containing protein [Candidatus Sumerlaeia bacterium]